MHDSDPDEFFYVVLGATGLILIYVLVAFLIVTFSSWLSSVVGYETSLDHTPLTYLILITIFNFIVYFKTKE